MTKNEIDFIRTHREQVAATLTDLLMADDQTPIDDLLRQAVQTLTSRELSQVGSESEEE